MSSQLTNQTPFKAELQTNKLLLVENISFQWRCNTETQTHALPFSLVLSQGPISGPRLSAQACVRGPIGSPQGCERPQGSGRIITLFISSSLAHPRIHTSTICSQREHSRSLSPCLSRFPHSSGIQNSEQRTSPDNVACKYFKLIYSGMVVGQVQ